MRRPPVAAKRDANEDEIVTELEAWGLSVRRMATPVDLLCGIFGKTAIAEVKSENGKLTPAQEEFKAGWKGNWIELRSVEDAADFAREMRGQE